MSGEWLTPREADGVLKVSLSTIRAMFRDQRLRARRLRGSRLLRIAHQDVEALLELVQPGPAGQHQRSVLRVASGRSVGGALK